MAGSLSGRIAAITGKNGRDVAFAASLIDAGKRHPFPPHGGRACLRIVVARHDGPSRMNQA